MSYEFNLAFKLNLNLFKALHALLQEKNVSLAAEKCGVTQSAMSVSLKKLRAHFNDELLSRSQGNTWCLTPMAVDLVEKVQHVIDDCNQVFEHEQRFDPKEARATLTLGMPDYVGFVLLPRLMSVLASQAPGIDIVHVAVNDLTHIETFHQYGLDFAIGDFRHAPDGLMTCRLFEDQGIIVGDSRHPIFRGEALTVIDLVQYPQVFVSLEKGVRENFILSMLREQGYDVDVKLITPHTLLALQVLTGTELLTNTVKGLAMPLMDTLNLAWKPVPYPLRSYQAKLYWLSRVQCSPMHVWLRDLIKELMQ